MSIIILVLIVIGAVILNVVYASTFEWLLHRFVMHRPFLKMRYAYEKHALTHHRIFRSDETYHLSRAEDKHTIPMKWWNAPVLIAIAVFPSIILSILFAWWIWIPSFVVFTLYYVAYEYMHWCMHLPRKRAVERTGIFFRLNGHHLLHHRFMGKNFNVVLPLADLMFGTLCRRSPLHFAQPQGPFIPNVQPKKDIPTIVTLA